MQIYEILYYNPNEKIYLDINIIFHIFAPTNYIRFKAVNYDTKRIVNRAV